jgi:hypothetical protein
VTGLAEETSQTQDEAERKKDLSFRLSTQDRQYQYEFKSKSVEETIVGPPSQTAIFLALMMIENQWSSSAAIYQSNSLI